MGSDAGSAQSHPVGKRVIVAGATGYIGQHVARRLKSRGHDVVSLARPGAPALPNQAASTMAWPETPPNADTPDVDTVVSCIASRTGVHDDAWLVEHDLNVRLLELARTLNAKRFVLLSAICVQKPVLSFQFAKRAFETTLAESGLDYAIIRPTAFFKSLAGQINRVKNGKPYLIFGNGELNACKPISAEDLARFIVDKVESDTSPNAVLPIGGPGPALTPLEQGAMLFELLGQPQRFRSVPPGIFKLAHGVLRVAGVASKSLREKAELARIGHYYATESMLLWDDDAGAYSAAQTPEFGTDTLRDFFASVLKHGLDDHDLGSHRVFDRG
ncbi:MAG: NAD(P)H-binding protein [Pseudomonadota bacterium]